MYLSLVISHNPSWVQTTEFDDDNDDGCDDDEEGNVDEKDDVNLQRIFEAVGERMQTALQGSWDRWDTVIIITIIIILFIWRI